MTLFFFVSDNLNFPWYGAQRFSRCTFQSQRRQKGIRSYVKNCKRLSQTVEPLNLAVVSYVRNIPENKSPSIVRELENDKKAPENSCDKA